MSFFNTILDIVFPINCVSCGKRGVDLCSGCLFEAKTAERESATWIFPLYDYRDPVIKKSLLSLKYRGRKKLARIFADILYEKILEELSELGVMENFINPILIPIPLSPKGYRKRGFNQAELICKSLCEIDNEYGKKNHGELCFTFEKNLLIKKLETKHQAGIKNRKERLKNLIGSFSVKNNDLIKNKNIILIDDITTTGATLSEARKVLKKSGARKIIAFTIAH